MVVVLMVFGAKRLPEMGKSMGEGMRGFKSAISGESDPVAPELHEAPAVVAALPAEIPALTVVETHPAAVADARVAQPVA